jgi:hypothetical protein
MANSEKKGRLIMTVRPLSYFFGPNAVAPYDMELAYKDETKDLVLMLEDEYGNIVTYNTVKELRDYITDLKNSGIFTSAAAFVNNRKINRFYFDMNNGVVRLDPERHFEPIYRYYAIRETVLGPNGEYIYVTGVSGEGSEGESTYSNLVDMRIENSESGDGNKVSIPQVGGIVREIINGNTYVVEFYDADRLLVNVLSFQARAVRVADLDLSPDTAVVDMYIMTNRPMEGDDNACFLYRGEDPSKLEIRVYLRYADGRTRDVTYENVTNGRLVIQGLNEITTDSITSEQVDQLQKYSVVYTLIRSNASLPLGPSQTPGGAVINPMSLTITKDMNVYVLEDVFSNLERVICAPYVETVSGNPGGDLNGEKIRVKFFGLYEGGQIHDITNICTYTNPGGLQENNFGTTQALSIRIPYGNAGGYKTFSFNIFCAAGSKRVKVNEEQIRIIVADRQATAGIYSGSFTKLGYVSGANSIEEISLESLLASAQAEFHDVTPDHIRIRDVIDTTYNYTELANSFGSSGIGYLSTYNHDIATDKPVLIEFVKVSTGEGGLVTNIYKTGAMLHYVRVVDGGL